MTEQTVRALVGRVDGLETRLDALGRDVRALDAGVKVLLAGQESPGRGQPDWLTVNDPAAAEEMLTSVDLWVDRYAHHLGLGVLPCWPWHPAAVTLLVAAAERYREAYRGTAASSVSDYLTRVVPAVNGRLRGVLDSGCNGGAHRDGEKPYVVSREFLPDLARWWVVSRAGVPPGLTARAAVA